jgi:tetratricopeptide (TPR) repeat protein
LALNPDHPRVATSLNNLAGLYESQGRHAEAEPLYLRSLSIREKALGPEHPDVATDLNNLAVLYEFQGRLAEAEQLYKRALSIHEKALGPDHPRVAISFDNLGGLYEHQGRYADAEPLYKRSLAIQEKLFGLYESQGCYAKAEPGYKRPIDGEDVVERSDARGGSRLSLVASKAVTPRPSRATSARSRTATRRSAPMIGGGYCATALCRLMASM